MTAPVPKRIGAEVAEAAVEVVRRLVAARNVWIFTRLGALG